MLLCEQGSVSRVVSFCFQSTVPLECVLGALLYTSLFCGSACFYVVERHTDVVQCSTAGCTCVQQHQSDRTVFSR
jgi:hypothetical protein